MLKVPVVICGAGPVGLSLANGLHKFKITHLLLEKHPGTSIHPKARGIKLRAMEIFRSWGLESSMREDELPQSARRFLWLESIKGEIVGEVNLANQLVKTNSPTEPCLIAQDTTEQRLLDALTDSDYSQIKFSHKLIEFKQYDDYVECLIEDKNTNQTFKVQCQYLVATDGIYSSIRDALGIAMQGNAHIGKNQSVYCEVDLSPWLADKPFIVSTFTDQAQQGRFIMMVDLKKQWIFGRRAGEDSTLANEEEAIAFVRDTIGEADIAMKIQNVGEWEMAALNAEKYRAGRVFLCGDAAHRLPPTGGMGMNTGIADAHNLAWKLAYVIKEIATDELLDSYEQERQPISQFTIDWSVDNAYRIREMYIALAENDLDTFRQKLKTQDGHLNHPGLDMGYIYQSSAISDDGLPCTFDPSHYKPYIKAGMRMPHCEVVVAGKIISTLDLCEHNYVLLIDKSLLDNYRDFLPIPACYPLDIYIVGDDISGQDARFQEIYGFNDSHAQAILIRPDQHIAYKKI